MRTKIYTSLIGAIIVIVILLAVPLYAKDVLPPTDVIRVKIGNQTATIKIETGLTGAIVAADVVSSTAKVKITLPDLTAQAHEIDGRNKPGERVHVAGEVSEAGSYLVPSGQPERYYGKIELSDGTIVQIDSLQEFESGEVIDVYGLYTGQITSYSGDEKETYEGVDADLIR